MLDFDRLKRVFFSLIRILPIHDGGPLFLVVAFAAQNSVKRGLAGVVRDAEGIAMNLDFAVDRLYEVGWTPADDAELERLPDGRRVPTISCVKREFGRAGLELSIQHTPKFQCYRATWKSPNQKDQEAKGGTVVAACEREAAVYALAQLHATRTGQPVAVG